MYIKWTLICFLIALVVNNSVKLNVKTFNSNSILCNKHFLNYAFRKPKINNSPSTFHFVIDYLSIHLI